MTKRAEREEQIQSYIGQEPTTWKRMYEEYKRNTATLKKEYSPLLKREIISKQSKDSYSLANIFKDIAEENINLARAVDTNPSLKLYHYNDGAIACHHGLSVMEKANCNNNPELQKLQELEKEICGSLNDIQTDMVSACEGRVELLAKINDKTDLSNISKFEIIKQLRTEVQEQLEAIETAKAHQEDNKAYIELTANVFKKVAHGMQDYLAALYGEAERILGPPPCDYNVIGLGSMALRQMTPWSDLEFAILTDNENYKQSEDFRVKEYFKNLTHLVHFKVINLRETIMPLSSYGFDFKDFIKTAVNFDLGGKTPLGRIEKEKPYELIQTVEGMINDLKNKDNKTSHRDTTLSFILQKSCPIYQHGDKDLATEYQTQANEFLLSKDETNERLYCENRAVQVLSKEGVEIDYTKSVPQERKKTPSNLEQFSCNAYESQGKLFDVKQEIYRMPDRFIYNLGIIHGIQEESGWDTIDELRERGIINSEGADNLKKALSFATNLRLKTYSNYGYQKDTMDFVKTYEVQSNDLTLSKVEEEELNRPLTTVFKLANEDLQEDGALFEYYYTTLALRNSLEAFCELENLDESKEEFFNNNTFYQNDVGTKAQINFRLLRYKNALKWQLKALQELEIKKQDVIDNHSDLTKIDLEIATCYYNIGMISGYLGKPQAVKYHEKALDIRQKTLDQYHPDVANSLDDVGSSYVALGQYEKALDYQKAALDIRQKTSGQDHPDVAKSYNNIGYTYEMLRDHKNALEHHEKALEIKQKTLGHDHPNIGINLNNIGSTHRNLGNYKKALEYTTQALKISQEDFGESHIYVGMNLNSIALTYRDLGVHNKALEYFARALEIFQKSLQHNHHNVINCKNSIAQAYGYLSMYKEALAELADIILVKYKTNQPDKISFYSKAKIAKDLYEGANELLNQQIVQGSKISTKIVNNLKTALAQFKECNNFQQSDIINKKILDTLDLLIKAQTSLYQNSTKNKLAIRKQLNEYQKQYDALKKSMDDKQLRLQEIEEYLAEQQQGRDAQSEVELANNTLSTIETHSSLEEIPENPDLLSLTGENHNEHEALNLN